MKRTKRLTILCGELAACDTFADVGCDHGYCTQYMLEHDLCRHAIISDISAPSLHKAEKLLSEYIQSGKVTGICCAGLEKIPQDTEQVLIAGMGGEEILTILREGFLPKKLLLQPMQHAPKVREYLLRHGYEIVRDFTFKDGKYYDLIRAELKDSEVPGAAREYGALAIEFGYDNLHAPGADFMEKVDEDIQKCRLRLERAGKSVPAVEKRLDRLLEIRDGFKRNI